MRLRLATILAALLAGAFSQTPPSRSTGAISGVVTDTATGRPIGGAVVMLRRTGPPTPGQFQQMTDARGRFVFDELIGSKQYFLTAIKSGYADGNYGQLPGQSGLTLFALADGQWLSTANVALDRVGAIGGMVTDEFGEPVVGTYVRALTVIDVAGRRELAAAAVATTDDRGEYRVTGLSAGRYVVMVPSVQTSVPASATPAQVEGLGEDMYQNLVAALARNPATRHLNNGAVSDGGTRLIIGNYGTPPAPADGHERAYPMLFYPGTTSISAATTIEVAGGADKSGVNLSLQPVPAVRVSGRLQGMTNPSRLTLRLIAAGLENLAIGSEVATTIVNPDGTFTFLSVPGGMYTLETRQSWLEFQSAPLYIPYTPTLPPIPGHETLGRQVVTSHYRLHLPQEAPYVGRTTLSIGAVDLSDVVVPVQPSIDIHGRFVYEDVLNGPPQRAQLVVAEPADGNWSLGFGGSHPEGPDAEVETFTITGLAAGAYNLRLSIGPAIVVKSIMFDGQDYLRKPIDVGPGRPINGVVITLSGKGPVLSGAVRDAQGGVAEGAAVIVFTTDRTAWPQLGLTPLLAKIAMSAADGTFTMPPVPAGEYFAVATPASAVASWTDPAFLAKAAAVASRVTLLLATPASIDLKLVAMK